MGDDTLRTRQMQAGALHFLVECPSAKTRRVVEAVFADLGSSTSESPELYSLTTSGEADRYDLELPGRPALRGVPLATIVMNLVSGITRFSLDREASRLHLHCAAVERDGKGVVIAASSGTGKTTLTAALLARHWSYLSDEAVALQEHGRRVSAYPKPLSFKPGAATLVPEITRARVQLSDDEPPWTFAPASAFGAPLSFSTTPNVVVLLERSGTDLGSASTTVPLHPADAVAKLMTHTMDPERYGSDAVIELSTMAASGRCAVISVGELHSEVRAIEALVDRDPEPLDVRRLPLSDVETDGWRPSHHVTAVQIGERAVLHHVNGNIIAVDEAGTALWLALLGEAPYWWDHQLFSQATTRVFLGQLAGLGFVLHEDLSGKETAQ